MMGRVLGVSSKPASMDDIGVGSSKQGVPRWTYERCSFVHKRYLQASNQGRWTAEVEALSLHRLEVVEHLGIMTGS
jgi:hypothetical protein